eukprot:182600-Rhodomonas_salina.1
MAHSSMSCFSHVESTRVVTVTVPRGAPRVRTFKLAPPTTPVPRVLRPVVTLLSHLVLAVATQRRLACTGRHLPVLWFRNVPPRAQHLRPSTRAVVPYSAQGAVAMHAERPCVAYAVVNLCRFDTRSVCACWALVALPVAVRCSTV